ncbi:methylamine utilization protein MauE [Acetobacter nitrogenifigens DSM 23921 = NBRC 105050]|uniref:Methylamine utilization protein MauE n=1 Tax=Acetobacter nitrogenifigens DSM 23921 = NBRC 105050 TaxID=1120919 RepID=A0A511X7G7_9PROT|nr:MauE/DoxX family redox-associated membrane protein [Acetobacter nitrogenifigens]GBQ95595.1 methylamine utilization protein MauE [Acetobacter nitrogenifigens DSM 23921 = NBRC 105050]GEN58871.1 hypothetical protein ANI02nite_07550 [Acetobacter nitrogenifigens DSM 23921 = NBRC 105050]
MNGAASDVASVALNVAGGVAGGAVGALFLAASVSKMRDRDGFLGQLAAYRLLPDALLTPVLWLLIGAETLLGAGLLSGVAPTACGLASAALLLVFSAAMAINVIRGRTSISCGCLPGSGGETLSWRSVARSVALAVAALFVAVAGSPDSLALRAQGAITGACLLALAIAASRLTLLPAPRQEQTP